MEECYYCGDDTDKATQDEYGLYHPACPSHGGK